VRGFDKLEPSMQGGQQAAAPSGSRTQRIIACWCWFSEAILGAAKSVPYSTAPAVGRVSRRATWCLNACLRGSPLQPPVTSTTLSLWLVGGRPFLTNKATPVRYCRSIRGRHSASHWRREVLAGLAVLAATVQWPSALQPARPSMPSLDDEMRSVCSLSDRVTRPAVCEPSRANHQYSIGKDADGEKGQIL